MIFLLSASAFALSTLSIALYQRIQQKKLADEFIDELIVELDFLDKQIKAERADNAVDLEILEIVRANRLEALTSDPLSWTDDERWIRGYNADGTKEACDFRLADINSVPF